MKRLLVIVLVVLVVCSATACEQKTDILPADDTEWVYPLRYAEGVLSGQGYYFVQQNEGLLSFADIGSGGSTHLCTVAGCDHKREDLCDARLSIGLMFFWNNQLYYIDNDVYGWHLYCRDETGMREKKIGSIGEKYIEEQKSLQINDFAQTDGYLYLLLDIWGSVYSEELGGYAIVNVLDVICRVNLSTGAEEIILEQSIANTAEAVSLCAVKKDEVLFTYVKGLDMVAGTPEYSEALNQVPMTLKKWSGETGNVVTIFEKPVIEFESVQMVDGHELYYKARSATNTINPGYTYSYNLVTGEEKLVCKELLSHLGGGYALSYDRETQKSQLFNILTGEYLNYELPKAGYTGITLCAMSDNGCVLKYFRQPERENILDVICYFYVTYDSLVDGFQESDLVTLHIEEILKK